MKPRIALTVGDPAGIGPEVAAKAVASGRFRDRAELRILGVPEDVRMALCVGTSLAIIIPTSIASFRAHYRRGFRRRKRRNGSRSGRGGRCRDRSGCGDAPLRFEVLDEAGDLEDALGAQPFDDLFLGDVAHGVGFP